MALFAAIHDAVQHSAALTTGTIQNRARWACGIVSKIESRVDNIAPEFTLAWAATYRMLMDAGMIDEDTPSPPQELMKYKDITAITPWKTKVSVVCVHSSRAKIVGLPLDANFDAAYDELMAVEDIVPVCVGANIVAGKVRSWRRLTAEMRFLSELQETLVMQHGDIEPYGAFETLEIINIPKRIKLNAMRVWNDSGWPLNFAQSLGVRFGANSSEGWYWALTFDDGSIIIPDLISFWDPGTLWVYGFAVYSSEAAVAEGSLVKDIPAVKRLMAQEAAYKSRLYLFLLRLIR
jgi:hypothetical protein